MHTIHYLIAGIVYGLIGVVITRVAVEAEPVTDHRDMIEAALFGIFWPVALVALFVSAVWHGIGYCIEDAIGYFRK